MLRQGLNFILASRVYFARFLHQGLNRVFSHNEFVGLFLRLGVFFFSQLGKSGRVLRGGVNFIGFVA